MKVSRTWLQTFFEKELPAASELAELFTFHSCEVEGIEKSVDGDILDLKIRPDRAHYCLSHRGIAEEIHVITGQPLKNPRETPPPVKANPSIIAPKITITTSPAELDSHGLFCRRYMSRRIENVTVGESPEWMKNHLEGIGERVINSIVDSTNLIMFDTGQPLHAFDADAIQGDIVVRAATEGEKIILLDGKEVTLKAVDHVIADDMGPLAIAGVKGGQRAQVTATTKNLIIESANFNPSSVRHTSTRLNLRNESSKRFENEITPELAADGIDCVSALIALLSPTSATSMSDIVDIYPAKPAQIVITTTRAYINDRLGVEVPEKNFNEILGRLGITGTHDFVIPYHRLDLTIADDLVEEIGRIYGYEKISTHLPAGQGKGVTVLPSFYLAEKIKNILTGAGFSEVNLYTLVAKGLVETAYPLAKDKSFARANLTDGMLVCLEKNALNADLLGLDAIKVFEIGRAFTATSSTGEVQTLAIGVTQVKKIKGVKSEGILADVIALLSKELGVEIPAPKIISKGIHAVVEINLDTLAAAYKLPANASYTDLGFGPAAKTIYKKFSVYPFIVRDIAVFTPESENVDAVKVWETVQKGIADAGAEALLTRHALFDTFKKDGKVSYAFRMVFQSMEKTLTDDATNGIMEKIYGHIKANKWEVR